MKNVILLYSEQCADNLFCPHSVSHTTFSATCMYFSCEHVNHHVCCQRWIREVFFNVYQPVLGWQEVFSNVNLFYKQGLDVGALSCVQHKHMCYKCVCLLHFQTRN